MRLMLSPNKAFDYFFGIHLHFNNEKYSVVKYGVTTSGSRTKFDGLSEAQKYKFQWLANKFGDDTQNLVYTCIACEFAELDIRYAEKIDIIEAYYKFRSRRESLTYDINCNYDKYKDLENKNLRKVVFSYLSGKFSPEFILLLLTVENSFDLIYNDKTLTFARQKLLKLLKYQDFFNTKKYITLIQNDNTVSA